VVQTSLIAGRDTASITVACVCAVLQVVLLALTRWAYLGFGWRMYSKIAGDMSLPNIDRTRHASLRMDRFMALAKLDVQLMSLLLIVGVINGINPGGGSYLPSLLVSSTVGVVAMAIWLTLCCIAVTYGKPRMALFAEFSHPFSYIVAAAYMFSSVYYGELLNQIHGQAYLLAFPVLFLIGRTFVWWDARLLSGSDLAIMHRDLYGKLPENVNRGHLISIGTESRFGKGETAMANLKDCEGRRAGQKPPKMPSGLTPLIRGSWLLKLPSNDQGYGKGGYKSFNRILGAFNVQPSGKWRFFQLSHDGSTLRWDWRKYVLLMHVESVHACTEDLTITLKFTLEPDLRLKCKDKGTHAAWARGLTLIVMMLGNPYGLEDDQSLRNMLHKNLGGVQNQPPSPSKLLNRLTSGSLRASAAGLLTKDTLRLAAVKARKAFSDQSQNSSDEEMIDVKSDECLSSYKPHGGDATPTKTFNIHASADMIHRRKCTPLSGNDRKIRSPFQINPAVERHLLARSESVHLDIETGLRKPLQDSPVDSLVAPRASSFTAAEKSSSRIEGYHKGYALEGWRSNFSKGNPHRFLDRGNSYSPNSENGAQQIIPHPRATSPLRRVGKADMSLYKKRDSLDASQYAPHSDAWQQKFDAGMASMDGSTTDGSPSVLPTPRSSIQGMPRTVSVNVEIIDFSALSFGKMLGRGAEGPVYAAWYQETPVAVKRASCQTEIDVHLHAGWHDNVVNLRGLAHNGGHSYLVMELCPRGTLDMLIHKGSASTIDPNKLLPIARSIARGMLHLHRRLPPIFHRDLKPGNIFIGHGFVMKIGDFGMARYAVEKQRSMHETSHNAILERTLTPGVIGTAAYSAPELLSPSSPRSNDVSDASMMLKADVYSFGVIIWELLERKRPFADMDGFQIQTQWIINPEHMKFRAPEIPPNLDATSKRAMSTLCELVTMCTAWNPAERPDFHTILGKIKDAISRDSNNGTILNTATSTSLVSPFCG
jgi:hypothetical protein